MKEKLHSVSLAGQPLNFFIFFWIEDLVKLSCTSGDNKSLWSVHRFWWTKSFYQDPGVSELMWDWATGITD